MEMTMDKTPAPKWRKHAVGLALGMLSGFAGALAMDRLVDSGALGEFDGSRFAAAIVGLIFFLTAIAVAVGLLNPRIGAQYLNVENAEELRDQRRMLAFSAVSMVAWGLMLFVLAVSGAGGIVSPTTALATVVVLLAAAIALGLAQWRLMDELLRSVSSEGGNLAFYLTMLFGGGWAVLAHLGFAQGPAPLDWMTLFSGMALVATFVAAGRRGLLAPR